MARYLWSTVRDPPTQRMWLSATARTMLKIEKSAQGSPSTCLYAPGGAYERQSSSRGTYDEKTRHEAACECHRHHQAKVLSHKVYSGVPPVHRCIGMFAAYYYSIN